MGYLVTLKPSQHAFNIDKDTPILDAALEQGISLNYGCRTGHCGSCRARLINGDIKYVRMPEALSESQRQAGDVLLCQAHACSDLVIEADVINTTTLIPIKSMPARVAAINHLNHDVLQIFLKLPPAIRLKFLAGQYVDFVLKDGKHRSFSIANAPHNDTHLELHIRHITGGRFTSELFDNIQVKDILRLKGPFGNFYLRDKTNCPAILMAGGTGFAPIKGIIEYAIAAGINRPLHLYWGAKTRRDLYMHAEAQEWAERYANISYTAVLSEPDADDEWQGATGFVHDAILQDFADLSGVEIYASGPPAMVYAGRDVFLPRGLAQQNYFSDAFEFAND